MGDDGTILLELRKMANAHVFVKTKDGLIMLDQKNIDFLDFKNFVLVCKNVYLNPSLGITKERFFNMLGSNKQFHRKYFAKLVALGYVPTELPIERRQEILTSSEFASLSVDDLQKYLAYNPTMITFAWEFAKARIANDKPADAAQQLEVIKRYAYFKLRYSAEKYSKAPLVTKFDNIPWDFECKSNNLYFFRLPEC